MVDAKNIKEHMEVIGADGAHVGTVDAVEGDRIKLTKRDSGSGSHQGHHHFISTGLVAGVEGNAVRLSATGANAILFEEEEGGSARAIGIKHTDGWNWNKVGLGALALGAVGAAAAALKSRKGTDDEDGKRGNRDDFELRLQTDENVRLISSSKVEGTPVVGRDGTKLGTIQNFMVDKYTGRVAYAVMSFGGVMGFGTSLFPLPWPMLDYDVEKDGYVLNVTKEQLANAPKFEASEAPEFNTEYRRRVLLFYRRA